MRPRFQTVRRIAVVMFTLVGATADAQTLPKPATRPASDVPGVDMVVDPSGKTKYRTISSALSALDPGGKDRVIILIRNGVYPEHLVINRPNVTLRGEDREKTRIEYSLTAGQWIDKPDDIGRGVLNINGDDTVLEHLTVLNTNKIRTHAFALYGRSTRTLTQDCDFLSEGNDTVGLWPTGGGFFYHADCRFRGQVDFLCPRGWCYAVRCTFDPVNEKTPLWHDGEKDPTKKLVLRDCRVLGEKAHHLARHPRDAQFYFVGCLFSKFTNDVDQDDAKETPPEQYRWGRRAYFADCHRDGGNQPWHADNLATAAGAPTPKDVTAAWTFGGKWDPERTDAPRVVGYELRGPERVVDVRLSEPVTVRGKLFLLTKAGKRLPWTGANGEETMSFAALGAGDEPVGFDASEARVFASLATTTLRPVDLSWLTRK